MKHAEILAYEEDELLWSKGLLGFDSLRKLFNAVFFMNGKVLCLHGGREHKALNKSQFSFGVESGKEFVQYAEFGSKNGSGSYKDKSKNKVIEHFANESLGEHCYVHLIRLYLEKLAPVVKANENADFYWKPKVNTPVNENVCWYTLQSCGKNFFGTVVKSVCEHSGKK